MINTRINEQIKNLVSILLSKNGLSILLSLALIPLAILRLTLDDPYAERMDALFFAVIGIAFLVHLIPLDRLKSLKAGGFEISLDQPQIHGAVEQIIDRRELAQMQQDDRLRRELSRLEDELETIRGSRVLWIDDHPHKVVGERRLIRLLGVEVVTVTSSEEAEHILEKDNDFDLIVTDVKRGCDSHEGVNFIKKLRDNPDPIVKELPAIFYSAYDLDRLVELTRPAGKVSPVSVEITNFLYDLVPKIIKLLADARSPLVPSRSEQKL